MKSGNFEILYGESISKKKTDNYKFKEVEWSWFCNYSLIIILLIISSENSNVVCFN